MRKQPLTVFDEKRKQAEARLARRLQNATSIGASDAALLDYKRDLKRIDAEETKAIQMDALQGGLPGRVVPRRT
jgi:hypothetical protein